MSLSKEPSLVAERPRQQPKCTRCSHHGILVPLKGHIRYCPFLHCDCWKCFLISERTRTTSLQRSLKKDRNKEQRTTVHTGDSGDKPPAEGTCSVLLAADGDARRDAALERPATTTTWSPHDLRRRPAAGGDTEAGLDSGKMLPFTSREEGPANVTRYNAPHSGEFVQAPPLPVIHFPFRMSAHHPSGYVPYPNLLLNVPWFPPVPVGLYNDVLRGPLMFPHFQPGAAHHHPPPPEPGPPADCRRVFFTLQPPPFPQSFQEELMSRQLPQPPRFKHTERDIEELD
ncbi:uncharacterized protein LOC141754948 [Sebastes fasciatus]|uniref:uncharacterized protein LOC141754948 n=1 Tax=Sebastes fasciatus TaxID=394691 RepID=UPI003D9F40A9